MAARRKVRRPKRRNDPAMGVGHRQCPGATARRRYESQMKGVSVSAPERRTVPGLMLAPAAFGLGQWRFRRLNTTCRPRASGGGVLDSIETTKASGLEVAEQWAKSPTTRRFHSTMACERNERPLG